MNRIVPLIVLTVGMLNSMDTVPSLMKLSEPAAAAELEKQLERWSDRWTDSIEQLPNISVSTVEERSKILARMYDAAWESMGEQEQECRCQLSKVHGYVDECHVRGEFSRVWSELLGRVYDKSPAMQRVMNQYIEDIVTTTDDCMIEQKEQLLASLPRIMKKVVKRTASRIHGWEGTVDKSLAKPCQPKQIALSSDYLVINGCTKASLFRVNIYDLNKSDYGSLIDAHECPRSIYVYGNTILVCGMDDSSISFWNIPQEKKLLSFKHSHGSVRVMASIPGGIVCGTERGALVKIPLDRLVEYAQQCVRNKGRSSPVVLSDDYEVELLKPADVQGAIVSLDARGYRVAAVSADGQVSYWDTLLNRCIKRMQFNVPIHQIIYLNRSITAVADSQGALILVDQDDNFAQRSIGSAARILRMDRLDGHITYTTVGDPSIVIWDPYRDKEVNRIPIIQKSPIEYAARDNLLALAVNSSSVMLKQAIPLKKIWLNRVIKSFESAHDLDLFLQHEYAERHDSKNDSEFMSAARTAIAARQRGLSPRK